MKKRGYNLGLMLTLTIVFFLLISMMSIAVGTSTIENSNQTSVEASSDTSDQIDVSTENPTRDLDSNSTETSNYDTSSSQDVDIMIAYTPAAKDWASSNDGGIQNTMEEAIGNANTAMDNSEIDLDINLTYSSFVNYTETGDDFETDLNRLRLKDGYMDEIHGLRDYYGADLVSLMVRRDEDHPVRGMAIGPKTEGGLDPTNAFSVVSIQDISSRYVFTHEIGHNFGAGHAKNQSEEPGPQLYDYSAGWRWEGDKSDSYYLSVMSYYKTWDDERILVYSNPDVTHEGDPTGKEGEANNARTIRETKDTVSEYQEPTPQIELLTPRRERTWYEGTEQEIEWDVLSGTNEVDKIDLYYRTDERKDWTILANNLSGTESSYTWEVPDIGDKSVQLRAEATDEAGYSREDVFEEHINIEKDTIKPDIELNEPGDDEIFSQNHISMNWNGSDSHSGIDHYEIRSGEEWIDIGELTDYVLSLELGHHEIEVKAVDHSGNVEIATVNVTIDTISPSIEILSPSSGDKLNTNDVTVEWGGNGQITNISRYEIRLDNGEWNEVSGDGRYTIEELEEGEHAITIRAVDEAGNTASETIKFEVEEGGILNMIGGLFLEYIWIFITIYGALLLVLLLLAKRKSGGPDVSAGSSYNLGLKDLAECGKCGSVIPGYLSQCPRCGTEFSDLVECKNCGSEIYDDVEECPKCGYDFRFSDEELGE